MVVVVDVETGVLYGSRRKGELDEEGDGWSGCVSCGCKCCHGRPYAKTVKQASTANIGYTNDTGRNLGLKGIWCTLPVTATNTCQFQIVNTINSTSIVHTIINTNINDMATLSWIPAQTVPLLGTDQIRVLNSDTIVVKYVNIDLVTE